MNTLRKLYFLILKKIPKLNEFDFISVFTQKLIYNYLKDCYFHKIRKNNTTHFNENDILSALKDGCYYHLYEHIELGDRDYDEFIIEYLCFKYSDYKYKITIQFKEAQLTIHKKKLYKTY